MEEHISVRTKSEVSQQIWNRIKSVLETRQISQVALQRACEKCGYRIPQPEISRLYSGKAQLTLYQLTAFAEALEIPLSYLMNEDAEYRRVNLEGNAFLTDPAHEMFQGYLGTFYTIFHSTAPDEEDKVLFGMLTFEPSAQGRICEARFTLNTGHAFLKGKEIRKYYKGQLVISTLGVAYCILVNERMGEFNVITFRHRSFWVRQIACRMGLALSVTAGEEKNPVAHKILLSRTKFSEGMVEKVLPFLKMETEGAYVRREGLEELQKEQEQPYDFDKLLAEEMDECILVDHALVRKGNKRMNRAEYAAVWGLLKSKSIGTFVESLTMEEDTAVYELMKTEGELTELC